jgi:exodeoxyribonuclease V gamma subunit
MENLLVLLDKVQQLSPVPVFSQDVIVVQNAGMQHWLNLSLAQQRGISMNVRYALPAQFLWKLVRSLASDENVPEQSPYSREVLTWRIYALLALDEVTSDPDFRQPTHYWQEAETEQKKATVAGSEQAEYKRYQLAEQLADLYEQYLIFRPEWIDAWAKGQQTHEFSNHGSNASSDEGDVQDALTVTTRWKAKLWRLLIAQQSYNPVSLMADAITNIDNNLHQLPTKITFFGINAMAPMWLELIHALSEHIDIHFFHLNPCFDYWGDIVSEKQAMKTITHWVEGHDDLSKIVGNPLLANLGQQGREFMALLQNYSTVNIDAFEHAHNEKPDGKPNSVLANIQQDILTLTDARSIFESNGHQRKKDDSITITSAHSTLREVQGLHDWLLHQFNDDLTLTPKDILVMCPQIENYAPYVNAVFTRGWQDLDDNVPPLPCSIADRSSKDSDPLIAAFIDILSLPDSRFQVSQLLGLLRLPAMQLKFDITNEELEKISLWLEATSVHWGLDQQHKNKILGTNAISESFTWQQGFARLLRGFAFGDIEVIYQEQLLFPDVEGDDGLLLGKVMLIIEQLQFYARQLNKKREVKQWQKFLFDLLEQLFVTENDHSFSVIYQAIEELVECCLHAEFDDKIDLMIIRDFLNSHFSQPDAGRQFMVGQVTFCSMLPMRSIPFKVIAVLGLNDGEFPRQRQPLGFDLMAMTPAKLGDRSRRGDDRYLFLEALISARQALYLSYQGRNIKNNNEQQASLVLKELIEYLERGYGWHLLESKAETGKNDLRNLPMQAFSEQNYGELYPSFDAKWLALRTKNELETKTDSNEKTYDEIEVNDDEILEMDVSQLIRFFQHPAKVFAQQNFNLYFENYDIELEDCEPFGFDRLQSYLLRENLLAAYLNEGVNEVQTIATNDVMTVEQVLKAARLGGKFPDLPTTNDTFDKWQNDSQQFSQEIIEQQADAADFIDVAITFPKVIGQHNVVLSARLPVKNEQLVFYRSSSAKAKDHFTLYIHQLILQVWQQQNAAIENSVNQASASENNTSQSSLLKVSASQGFYFDTKTQKITQCFFSDIADPLAQLQTLLSFYSLGLQQPLLINGALAEQVFKGKASKKKEYSQADFEKYWSDENAMMPFGQDPYLHYFWQHCPDFSHHEDNINEVYQSLYQSLQKLKPVAIRKNTKSHTDKEVS